MIGFMKTGLMMAAVSAAFSDLARIDEVPRRAWRGRKPVKRHRVANGHLPHIGMAECAVKADDSFGELF